jgi:uncharacterized repeat protein (TIGR03847 family)
MSPSFDFGGVDAFTAGTVGSPGQRVFYLQARGNGEVVTVKCEKQQVAALGQHLERLLQDLPAPTEGPLPATLELTGPDEVAWIVGQLRVAWEADLDRFLVMVEELDQNAMDAMDAMDAGEQGEEVEADEVPAEPDDDVELGRLRFELTRGQALAFAARAAELVAAGRPPCRFCGHPMDPDGHPCPRMN